MGGVEGNEKLMEDDHENLKSVLTHIYEEKKEEPVVTEESSSDSNDDDDDDDSISTTKKAAAAITYNVRHIKHKSQQQQEKPQVGKKSGANGKGVGKNVMEHYFPAKKQKHIVMPEHTKVILKHWPKAKNIGRYFKWNLI